MKNLFLLRHCEAYHFEENKSDHEKQLNENGRKCARLLKNWFEKNNIVVIGISYYKTRSFRDFKDKYNLPFDFLSDSTKSVALIYGANGIFAPKRMTFLINSELKIEKIYNKINVNTHAEKILTDLTD